MLTHRPFAIRRRPWRSRLAAGSLAVVVWITSVAPAAAVTWDTGPFQVSGTAGAAWSSAAAFPTDEFGSQLVGVAYRQVVAGVARVYYRRSYGGEAWEVAALLSSEAAAGASRPAIAAVGANVDAVWTEYAPDGTGQILYRTSADGGATWADPVPISPAGSVVGFAKVARDGAGRVLVTYTDAISGKVIVRISANGGVSFGSRRGIGQTSSRPWSDSDEFEAFPSVAVARGVFHLVFYANIDTLRYRRSIDLGVNWTAARTMTGVGDAFFPQVIASGSRVMLGYAAFSSTTVYSAYRRSTDKGATWSSERTLTSKSGSPAFSPVITVTGGGWTAAYERCSSMSCSSSAAYTRVSADNGATFAAPTRASHSGPTYAWPLGAGFAGNWVSVYATYRPSTGAERVWSMLGG